MSSSSVFLDRDRVVIENQPDYARSWGQVDFPPGSIRAVQQFNESRHLIVTETNQSAVGGGMFPEKTPNESISKWSMR